MLYIEPKRKKKETLQAEKPEKFLSLCDEKLKERLYEKETEKVAENLNTLQISLQKSQKPKLRITFAEKETLWQTAKTTLEDIKPLD